MPQRRFLVLAAAGLVGIAALYFLWGRRVIPGAPSVAVAPAGSASVPSEKTGDRKSSIEAPAATAADATAALAAQLNAPGGTLRHDLEVLNELFVNYQTNFPQTGNPVGENAEITAALTGANPAGFAFVPKNHPAINAAGELCDRWGTPFRFHQLSGRQMEIRSAGPDKKFGTADDVEFAPWPK